MYTIRLALEYAKNSNVYTVTSPDVPSLVTEGSAPEEIYRNVRETLEGFESASSPALERARTKTLQTVDLLMTA